MKEIASYAMGQWVAPDAAARDKRCQNQLRHGCAAAQYIRQAGHGGQHKVCPGKAEGRAEQEQGESKRRGGDRFHGGGLIGEVARPVDLGFMTAGGLCGAYTVFMSCFIRCYSPVSGRLIQPGFRSGFHAKIVYIPIPRIDAFRSAPGPW